MLKNSFLIPLQVKPRELTKEMLGQSANRSLKELDVKVQAEPLKPTPKAS
jgi:hypothetical protein